MTSTLKTPNPDKVSSPTPRRRPSPKPPVSATDKAQAVLAVWTDRCKPAEVCRQLQVNWITFNHWQTRAMEGLLQALESRVNLAQGEALSPRLQALLQKQQRASNVSQLQARLQQVQKVAPKSEESKMG
jgi:hypothetical protein